MGNTYILRKGVSTLDDLKDGMTARNPAYMAAQYFFVDSVHGSTSNDGTAWDKALAGLDAAIGKCTANHGDTIFVLPGHSESIIAAGTITADIAGINIVGVGKGEDRPTFTFTTADTATFLVTAADVYIENLIFACGKDGMDVLLDVNADGCRVVDCEFRSDETNAYQCDNYLDIAGSGANAADRCEVHGCRFFSITAGATSAINVGQVQDGLVFADNWIDGAFSAAGIESASAFTNALIARNYVSNRATGQHAIELSAAATGMCVDNRLYSDTLGTILDPGSLKCLGNLETDAIDQAGVDSPRTSAGGFADSSITAAVIATDAIDDDAIATGAIASTAFAAGAINAAAIATDAIDADALAANAVAEIADGVLDESLTSHLTAYTVGASFASVEQCCEKSDGAVLSGADPLFDISGGPIEVLSITGIVTTIIGGAANMSLQEVVTTPAGTVAMNAAPVAIDNDAAGTSYQTINTTGIFTPVTAGLVLMANSFATLPTTFLCPIGQIQALGSAAQSGVIKWYLRYRPLSPNSKVAAAA